MKNDFMQVNQMDLLNKWYSDRKRQWELYYNNINNSLLSDAIVYIFPD